MGKLISFYRFMMENHIKSDSPSGDLARDMKGDPDFPKSSISYERIIDYLERNAACAGCFDAFEECWNEYMLWREQDES